MNTIHSYYTIRDVSKVGPFNAGDKNNKGILLQPKNPT